MIPIYPISYDTIPYHTHQPTQLLLLFYKVSTTGEVTDIIPYLLSVHGKFCLQKVIPTERVLMRGIHYPTCEVGL